MFDEDKEVFVPIDEIDSEADLPVNGDVLYQAIDAILPDGRVLDGYRIVDRPFFLGLFVDDEHFVLHHALPEQFDRAAERLSKRLGVSASEMFPIKIRSRSTRRDGTHFEDVFDRGA